MILKIKNIIAKMIGIFILLSCYIAPASSNSSAINLTETEKQWIKDHPVIRVANEMDWPPYDFNENGEPKGLSIDHIQLLAKSLGLTIEFINGYTWAELLEQFKQRKIDVLPVFYRNSEREAFTYFSEAYYVGKLGVFTNKDNTTWDHVLLNKRIGIQKGSGTVPLVKKQVPGINLVEKSGLDKMVEELAINNVDAIIGNPLVIYYQAKQSLITNIQLSGFVGLNEEEQKSISLYVGVRKDWPVLHQILGKAMDAVTEETKDKMEAKWTNITVVQNIDWGLLLKIGIGFVFVLGFLYWNNHNLKLMVKKRTVELENEKQNAQIAQKSAEYANQEKSRFLANMSHELRTPMHAILGYTGIIKKKVDDPKIIKHLNTINTSGVRLTRLLDNLLNLSKLEAGKMTLQAKQNNLTEVVDQSINEVHSLCEAKNITVDFDGDSSIESIFDSVLVSQVITNLLSNAIKFSANDSHIIVSASCNTKMLRGKETEVLEIVVTDQGIGIPATELDTVFNAFTQSSKTRTEAGGTGLGLPICQEIARLHKGQIWADSPVDEETSTGTAIHFMIPAIQENNNA